MLTDDEIKETKLECVTALKGGADSMASISYYTLYELCDLALRAVGVEAVAGRLPKEGYYLQDSRTTVGNDMLFWKKDGNGYTTDLTQAHVFTQAERDKGTSRDTDVFWPVAYIHSIVRPVADFQSANREAAAALGGGE